MSLGPGHATPWKLNSGHLLVSQSRPPKTTLGITERLFLDISKQLSLSLPIPEKQETRVYLYCYFLMNIGILSSIYNQDWELGRQEEKLLFLPGTETGTSQNSRLDPRKAIFTIPKKFLCVCVCVCPFVHM